MKVYITRKIPDKPVEMLHDAGFEVEIWDGDLPPSRDTLLSAVADIDGLLCMLTETVDDGLLDAAPNLRVISNFAVGYDNIDVPAVTARGIKAGNTPEVHTETTADTAFMLLMSAARRLPEAIHDVKAGNWHTWEPLGWLGRDIHHTRLGIIGFGRIGQAVARRGRGFGMEIVYYNRSAKTEAEAEMGATRLELDDLLETSDFVCLNVPLTDETYHIIGERELALMKPSAVLVNASRGRIGGPVCVVRRVTGKDDLCGRAGCHGARADPDRSSVADITQLCDCSAYRQRDN
jgi:glyoxylate reductase